MSEELDFVRKVYEIIVVVALLIAVFAFFLGYVLPEASRQSKTTTCIENGYFDYDEKSDRCWDIGGYNVDSFDCVEEGKCKGRHQGEWVKK